jgi:uncharacterized protein YjiS (DUF1127 family)
MSEAPKSELRRWITRRLSPLSDWMARERARSELESLAATGELDQVLSDVGLTRSDLPALLAHAPDSDVGLQQMAARLGISSQALALAGGRRDLQRRCLSCEAKKPCEHWLEDEVAPEGAPSFCPNAEELNAIKKRMAAGVLAP